MSAHRAIVEAGPGAVRQLCCEAVTSADDEVIGAALDAIDDGVALVGGRPVAVGSLWRAALRSLSCVPGNEVVVVHPSWWPSSRVAVVTAATATLTGGVRARPRSWLLKRASEAAQEATVVVEIAERLVAVVGAEMVAVARRDEPHLVVQRVARAVAGMGPGIVVIDAAGAVAGAAGLAALIADAMRGSGPTVVEVDDARLTGLARSDLTEPPEPTAHPGCVRPRARRLGAPAACAAAVTVFCLAVSALAAEATVDRPGAVAANSVETAPPTFLVEGRVALTVPANWPTQRVVAGSGSARVQVTSPSDPEVALHITQSAVAGETLSGTAERLKRAIDAEPAGVFVDFDPSGSTAGRAAVTYREVRANHHVRWTVFVDGPVRISIGCQSRPGAENGVRDACEQAVRSARAIGI
ncbi:MAG: type VII secretion-associated protein [Mycobacterium sp.]|uniref:type VII secretion-associated protein n=1 Tax=Mycobacterium sp. TaxID=1785 RepID=UPI002BC63741|nr:type VII secretion-associated protein [Mycobacterium sp.]